MGALPDRVQAEALRLFEEVETDLVSPPDLTPEGVAAIEDASTTCGRDRWISMNEMDSLFERYRTK